MRSPNSSRGPTGGNYPSGHANSQVPGYRWRLNMEREKISAETSPLEDDKHKRSSSCSEAHMWQTDSSYKTLMLKEEFVSTWSREGTGRKPLKDCMEDIRVKESRRRRPKQSAHPAAGRGQKKTQRATALDKPASQPPAKRQTTQYPPRPLQVKDLVAVAFKESLYLGYVTKVVEGGNAKVSFLDYVSALNNVHTQENTPVTNTYVLVAEYRLMSLSLVLNAIHTQENTHALSLVLNAIHTQENIHALSLVLNAIHTQENTHALSLVLNAIHTQESTPTLFLDRGSFNHLCVVTKAISRPWESQVPVSAIPEAINAIAKSDVIFDQWEFATLCHSHSKRGVCVRHTELYIKSGQSNSPFIGRNGSVPRQDRAVAKIAVHCHRPADGTNQSIEGEILDLEPSSEPPWLRAWLECRQDVDRTLAAIRAGYGQPLYARFSGTSPTGRRIALRPEADPIRGRAGPEDDAEYPVLPADGTNQFIEREILDLLPNPLATGMARLPPGCGSNVGRYPGRLRATALRALFWYQPDRAWDRTKAGGRSAGGLGPKMMRNTPCQNNVFYGDLRFGWIRECSDAYDQSSLKPQKVRPDWSKTNFVEVGPDLGKYCRKACPEPRRFSELRTSPTGRRIARRPEGDPIRGRAGAEDDTE
ncbi:hypothetical protein Bbelb_080850 [Branchiostoma belcheri]|nr:hypothetical protein Bbelb_080850 [Branchiostoma belcheri]